MKLSSSAVIFLFPFSFIAEFGQRVGARYQKEDEYSTLFFVKFS